MINHFSRASQHKRSKPHGFSLLEVIVALVLLSTTGVALFGWINESLITAVRLRERLAESMLLQQAQGLLATVNPAELPSGTVEQAGLRVEWESVPIQALRDNRGFYGEPLGLWRIGLARLSVRAKDLATGTQVTFEVLRPGLKNLQERSEGL